MCSEVHCDLCPFNGTEMAFSFLGSTVQTVSVHVKSLKICVPKYCLFSCLSLNYKAAVSKSKFEECRGAEKDLNMCKKGKQVEANRKSISFYHKTRACFYQWLTERSDPLQKWIKQGKECKWLLHVGKIWWEMSKSVLPDNTSLWFKWCPSLLEKPGNSVGVWHLLFICQLRDWAVWCVFGSRFNESTWWRSSSAYLHWGQCWG